MYRVIARTTKAFDTTRFPRDDHLLTLSIEDTALQSYQLRYISDDGRRYLYAHREDTFDLIVIDPLRDFNAGHNNLYSFEAMQLYRQQLTPGGVFCSWQDEYHIIPLTIAAAFPYVDQFPAYDPFTWTASAAPPASP